MNSSSYNYYCFNHSSSKHFKLSFLLRFNFGGLLDGVGFADVLYSLSCSVILDKGLSYAILFDSENILSLVFIPQ